MVLYLVFLLDRFSGYHDLAVVLSIVVIGPVVVVLMRLSWALGVRRRVRGWSQKPQPFE